MRAPSPSDFPVDVPGLGTFIFAKRKMTDELKIQAEYRRFTDCLDDPGPSLALVSQWLATLSVLMVSAPPNSDYANLMELDPLDEKVYADLNAIYRELSEKEGSFRRRHASGGPQGGANGGAERGVQVPPPVQPAPDRPQVS